MADQKPWKVYVANERNAFDEEHRDKWSTLGEFATEAEAEACYKAEAPGYAYYYDPVWIEGPEAAS
jgi:hypothetical protein